MRKFGDKEIPYVIAGAGGYADSPRAMHKIAKNIVVPFQTSLPDVTLAAYNETEPGFLRIKVTRANIDCEYYTIDFDDNPQGVKDSFTVALVSGQNQAAVTNPTIRRKPRKS
jgi:hypothetical protein